MPRVASIAARLKARSAVRECLQRRHELSAWYQPDACSVTLRSHRTGAFATGQAWALLNWRYSSVKIFAALDDAVNLFVDLVGVVKATAAARHCAAKHDFALPGERGPRPRVKQESLF